MKWALICGGKVREVFDYDPRGRFHPSLEFRQVGDSAKPEADTAPAPPPGGTLRDIIRSTVLEVLNERSVSATSIGSG